MTLMSGSSYIGILIGAEYHFYLLFAIWMGQIQSKLIYIMFNLWTGQYISL